MVYCSSTHRLQSNTERAKRRVASVSSCTVGNPRHSSHPRTPGIDHSRSLLLSHLEATVAVLRVRPVVEVVVGRHARLLASPEEHLCQGVHVPRILYLGWPAPAVVLPLLLGPVVLPKL